MKRRARVIFDWILGLTLLAIGLAGLVLPLLSGWVFIFAGLAVLSSHSPRAHRTLEWFKAKGRAMKTQIGDRMRDR